ncbi:hypothetical protein GIB67_008190 [Kingdonia uniflora]|uniref:Malectin-like domain-containing protein n=1 Tax=Kingdonia uniflora TaxID=39325 RepID=A0A7J7NXD6_9MAGN|nr:hypothetical protein GIB67_008190 [Kingdonia uniflora]
MRYTVFVSIDCGASSSYKDNHSITWVGDDSYTKSGENHFVQTLDQVSHVATTLRVFMNNKKNCYSVKVDNGDRVLIRATFFYGNYDNKSSPPSFDLHYNGNLWANVISDDSEFYYETVYSVKGDSVSICVAQTHPNHFPFISALEVRSLNSSMYKHVDPNYPLFLLRRVAYGTNETVRFPEDAYDRIWKPVTLGVRNDLKKVQSDTSLITVDVEDHPPKSVVQGGIVAANLSSFIFLNLNLPEVEVPIYANTYFSEVSQLNSTQRRSFQLYKDYNASNISIIPPYKSVLELHITNISASSNNVFGLIPLNDSTLPPLINAMEVFQVGGELTDGTNAKDVDALKLLQKSFEQLQESRGDPCLPSPYTWDWVACNSDERPRVTALYLDSLGLSGTLPDFSTMDALQTIDLHNNSFTQEVPDFLGSFSELKELSLANNNFSGTIPISLSQRNNLKLDISGNPGIVGTSPDTSPPPPSTSNTNTKSLLPVLLGTILQTYIVCWNIVAL